jgi:hypothetical protein
LTLKTCESASAGAAGAGAGAAVAGAAEPAGGEPGFAAVVLSSAACATEDTATRTSMATDTIDERFMGSSLYLSAGCTDGHESSRIGLEKCVLTFLHKIDA